MNNILFLVGAYRSGTTLLQSMLNAHPAIAFPPESHFVRNYIAGEANAKANGKPSLPDLERSLNADPYLRRLGIEARLALRSFIEEGEPFSYAALFSRYLEIYLGRTGKSIIGEKDPSNTEFLPEIKRSFPDARVIHIVRDPRDVVLSNIIKDRRRSLVSLVSYVCMYRQMVSKARKDGPSAFGDRYVEIVYEDLIREPEANLKRLCEKIGVEFDSRMLEFYKSSAGLVSNDEMSWKQNVFKPLMKDNKGKWRGELSFWEIMIIEGGCRKSFEELPYELCVSGNELCRLVASVPVRLFRGAQKAKRLLTAR